MAPGQIEQGSIMRHDAVILDLDETLIPEYVVVDAAFKEACQPAVDKHGLDAGALAECLRGHARRLWQASPMNPWCQQIGISSWEGLSGDLGGDHPELAALREWVDTSGLRATAWIRALAELGADDPSLAEELSEHLTAVRPRHHAIYPDTRDVLTGLQAEFRLAMITNGPPRVQWNKITSLELEPYFETVIVSGEVGVGKPDPRIFGLVLDRLGVDAQRTAMVGDSLQRDIAGARGAGLTAIWINRAGKTVDGGVQPVAEIRDLTELPDQLR